MEAAIVFDWGDTLMVDDVDQPGRMVDWPHVEEVPGAKTTLKALSERYALFVATGAPKATPDSIQGALARVGLDEFISGYFCPIEIGSGKPEEQFYRTVCERIGLSPEKITMVGDSLEKDVLPAVNTGMQAVWLNSKNASNEASGFEEISTLAALCQLR